MNEKIKQEAAHAMRLIGILNVKGRRGGRGGGGAAVASQYRDDLRRHGSAREERKRGPG